ncbi:probable Bud site selection protein 20 [Zygosaccharomyces bailii]|uniref:ZYBA0S15-01112g1_1 n=1 Tax=Zygosaccharomyces bailii (strain CLIB 213 / ATCC 58445 / CBS 680 / BCRC 21525 / NBRC 1098 / NCYC 1416 / NRRL Y-2227) TaxID=1333698 RepID=A0A8J2XEK8_ZYGB2|nr:ZYBA0S15-01112g1_1 [Zygosaccharomyces bailii CLIB 213]CDH13875.1 probable Bud site selection protein 20 [Zygosaccharomyces bailii ISA1307]SJM88462.1 probable Bud site selection protein 20 [Zygosaccharomyces bailii]
MGRYSVKRYKTKRRTKDLDVIFQELSSKEKIQELLNQPLDETKPGLGQHYCIHCAKYMESSIALKTHLKSKVHKRRVKELKSMPYTQEVADAANGVNLNKFLSRVEKFTTQTIPEKAQNEQILGSHLQEALANAKSTETTLPWASEGKELPHGTKDEDNDEAFMG